MRLIILTSHASFLESMFTGFFIFGSFLALDVLAKLGPDVEPIDINQVHTPKAQCTFSVHEKNASGPEIQGLFNFALN
jgi:hypothetical protein